MIIRYAVKPRFIIFVKSPEKERCIRENNRCKVRFEVFTAVTMKNGVFWVVTPCGSVRRLLVAACVVPSSPIFSPL
jgi:hypothetical protein